MQSQDDQTVCAECHVRHTYYKMDDPMLCKKDQDLIKDFKSREEADLKSRKEMTKTLKDLKQANWKNPKLKMEIDDAIQSNQD